MKNRKDRQSIIIHRTIEGLEKDKELLLEAVKLALHVHIVYVRESGDDSQEANEYQAKLEQAIVNATQR